MENQFLNPAPLTMRGALTELEVIQDSVAWIINSMNQNDERRGGFESHMYDLRHHVADAKALLQARIAGQLRSTEQVPEYDKLLSRC